MIKQPIILSCIPTNELSRFAVRIGAPHEM